jgi:hypothetical protein
MSADSATVNVAVSSGLGKLDAGIYSIASAGIFVAADSPIRDPSFAGDLSKDLRHSVSLGTRSPYVD